MDVSTFFKGVLRHHFWILCGVIAPLLLGGWFTTTGRMQEETEEGVDRIKTKYEAAQKLRSEVDHPNTSSEKGLDKLIDELQDEIYLAWGKQYERQEEILTWPPELGEDFINRVEQYQPIESFEYSPRPNPEHELLPTYRERYRNYIKKELPKLAEIVRAKWAASGPSAAPITPLSGAGDFGGFGTEGAPSAGNTPADTAAEQELIVEWDPADQSAHSRRFDWRNTPDKTPRTVDILYAQEDLWVLTGLMKIIAAANSDATGSYNATVREIMSIHLGSEVGSSEGSIGTGGGEDAAAAFENMWNSGSDVTAGGPSAGDMLGTTKRLTDPVDDRYVDADYNPIPAEELREVVLSDNPKPTDAHLFVAKRMPVRLKLKLDTRRINRFIAACGNAELMVEIRQVRINPSGMDGTGGIGGGDDAMMMMGMEVETSDPNDDQSSGFEALGGGPDMGRKSDPLADALAGMEIEEEEPDYILPVEFYGMVYIYNPVNTEKLDLEQVVAETTAEDVPAVETTEATGVEEEPTTTTEATEPTAGETTAPTEETPATEPAPPAAPASDAAPTAAGTP